MEEKTRPNTAVCLLPGAAALCLLRLACGYRNTTDATPHDHGTGDETIERCPNCPANDPGSGEDVKGNLPAGETGA